VVAQIATPCRARYRQNPSARYASWLKVSPSAMVTTALAATSSVIHAGLASRRVADGVTSAAQK
jgi:hypothetical protein